MLEDDRSPGSGVLSALPIFPLPNAVLLPGMVLPLNVFEPRYLALVDHALENGRHVGVPLLRPGYEQNYHGNPEVEPVFGVGRLVSHQRLADGRRFIRLEGIGRVRAIRELESDDEFRKFEVEALDERQPCNHDEVEVLKAQIERIARTFDAEDAEMVESVLRIPDARVLVYAITAIIPNLGLTLPDTSYDCRFPLLELQQRCLAAETADDRVRLLLDCTASICTELGESGRFPLVMLN